MYTRLLAATSMFRKSRASAFVHVATNWPFIWLLHSTWARRKSRSAERGAQRFSGAVGALQAEFTPLPASPGNFAGEGALSPCRFGDSPRVPAGILRHEGLHHPWVCFWFQSILATSLGPKRFTFSNSLAGVNTPIRPQLLHPHNASAPALDLQHIHFGIDKVH